MDEGGQLAACMRLTLAPEVGPATARRLIEAFGSPRGVFEAHPSDVARVGGVGPRRLDSIFSSQTEDRAGVELARAGKLGITILDAFSPGYPPGLAMTPAPPLVLYVLGRIGPADRLTLGIVGPRKASDYGRLMTRRLVPPLCSRGVTIGSGLAEGIDTEAHLAALESGGRTIAVLAQGLDTAVFPSVNRVLARRIVEQGSGALVSIFPLGTQPDAGLFPQRNAILAGLALGILVVEAGEKSGALLTAGNAADLGRTVMACPGDVTRANARGANRLITEGAPLIQCSDDILSAMATELRDARAAMVEESGDSIDAAEALAPLSVSSPAPPAYQPKNPLEAFLRDLLREDHRPIDFLLDECSGAGHTQGEIIQSLLMLELNGAVRQLPGRVYMWME